MHLLATRLAEEINQLLNASKNDTQDLASMKWDHFVNVGFSFDKATSN
jgi:hypothetical protein